MKNIIKLNIPDLSEGERVRTLETRRFPCPICGSTLLLKRSKVVDYMEDANGIATNVLKRTYYCPACGFKLHSQVWRPYGENPCCQQALTRLNPNSTKIVDIWVERTEGVVIYKKVQAFTCTCGIHYEWPEMAIIAHDRGADE